MSATRPSAGAGGRARLEKARRWKGQHEGAARHQGHTWAQVSRALSVARPVAVSVVVEMVSSPGDAQPRAQVGHSNPPMDGSGLLCSRLPLPGSPGGARCTKGGGVPVGGDRAGVLGGGERGVHVRGETCAQLRRAGCPCSWRPAPSCAGRSRTVRGGGSGPCVAQRKRQPESGPEAAPLASKNEARHRGPRLLTHTTHGGASRQPTRE